MIGRVHQLLALLMVAAATRDDGSKRDGLLSRVATRATGAVVDIVDPDVIIDQVDVDALMDRVDVNALLERVDPNIILDAVDVNALMDRVDVDAILDRVDVDELLDRVDVNALMDRVDVDALLARVDVEDLTNRAGIPDIVRESTGELAGSALDIVRRQVVAVDHIAGRTTYRLTGRDPNKRPKSPPALEAVPTAGEVESDHVTGHYAGPISRLAAFALDATVIWFAFLLGVAALAFAVNFVMGVTLDTSWQTSVAGVALISLWAFLYLWLGLSVAGKTIGMGVVGLSVVTREGAPISGRQAAIRTVVLPTSFLVFGLGFLGIIISPERRSLHDVAGHSVVVYDWGDRPAEMPGPLAHWLERHGSDDEEVVEE
ncbi:MAG: RDD family protein [Actinomycetota bacterium]